MFSWLNRFFLMNEIFASFISHLIYFCFQLIRHLFLYNFLRREKNKFLLTSFNRTIWPNKFGRSEATWLNQHFNNIPTFKDETSEYSELKAIQKSVSSDSIEGNNCQNILPKVIEDDSGQNMRNKCIDVNNNENMLPPKIWHSR